MSNKETQQSTWERDLLAYVTTINRSGGHAESHRCHLAAAVRSDPASASFWWSFLLSEEAGASPSTLHGQGRDRISLCDLYRWATKLVPRQVNYKNIAYLSIWLGYARQQWLRSSSDDARDTFKTLKSQHIGQECAIMYAEWAGLEYTEGNVAHALSILSKGIKAQAQPASQAQYTLSNREQYQLVFFDSILLDVKSEIEQGSYVYMPFFRLADKNGGQNDGQLVPSNPLQTVTKVLLSDASGNSSALTSAQARSLCNTGSGSRGTTACTCSTGHKSGSSAEDMTVSMAHTEAVKAPPYSTDATGAAPATTISAFHRPNSTVIKREDGSESENLLKNRHLVNLGKPRRIAPESSASAIKEPFDSQPGVLPEVQNAYNRGTVLAPKTDVKPKEPEPFTLDKSLVPTNQITLEGGASAMTDGDTIPVGSLVRTDLKPGGRQSHGTEPPQYVDGDATVPLPQAARLPHVAAQSRAAVGSLPPLVAGGHQQHKRVIEDENSITVRGIAYTKLECIGKGGSSRVYKVMAPNRKIFALKRIRLTGRDAEAAAGFLDEITLLNRLRGRSNIIQLIDSEVHRSEALIFMVLEYGDIDLARLLQKQETARKERGTSSPDLPNTVDENFIRLYWQQMLQAVDTIHRERIVHSDLKPANFLVVEGQLKLIDFGIAKAIQSDTTSIARESQVGTLNYMSPEAILGGASNGGRPPVKVGRASDIWSLGCILFQMVYGRTPFAHLPFIQKMHAITDDRHRIEFPALRNATLLDVVRRCLDRNPKTRITMRQLLDHPFLQPEGNSRSAPSAQSEEVVHLNQSQLQKLLVKFNAAGPMAERDVGPLSEHVFRQLATGEGSPELIPSNKRLYSAPVRDPLRQMQLPN